MQPSAPEVPPGMAEAVKREAARFGCLLLDDQAARLVQAAFNHCNTKGGLHKLEPLHVWNDSEGLREAVRRDMNHELIDGMFKEGLIPVEIPRETITYHKAWLLTWGEPGGEVPEQEAQADPMSHNIRLSLQVKCRKAQP